MRPWTPLLAIALLILAVGAAFAQAEVSKISYQGWTNCYELSNASVKVVIVPDIGGRVMEYSLDGENALWQNKDEIGKTSGPNVGKKWRNYGGYKAWNAPEGRWRKPDLDYFYDSMPAQAEIIPGKAGVRVTTPPIAHLGIRFTREVYLSDNTSRVHVVEKMKNVTDREIEWSVWDVTQVNVPCWMAFPLNEQSRFAQGWQTTVADKTNAQQISRVGNIGILEYKGVTENWGTDAGAGWMAYMKGQLAYVKRWSVRRVDTTYPDNGCDAEFFTAAPDRNGGYAEMEVLGPLVKLKPGQETELVEDWYLTRLNQSAGDASDVISRLRLLQKRGMLPRGVRF